MIIKVKLKMLFSSSNIAEISDGPAGIVYKTITYVPM